jgi:glycerophosphoryl diester phosphodiesterase
LELDLVISKDKEVIISHEPFFSHEIATTPDGVEITKDTEHSHNMYQLSYNQIKTYDVGNRPHERFPIQQKMSVHKPSFRDMVIEVEAYVTQLGVKKPLYNIEIKRKPNFDNTFHPEASEFAQLVVEVVNSLGIADRTFIQSFDIQSLIETKKQTDNIRLVYLIENEKPIHENIDALGFTPDVYSPYFKLIDQEVVDYCKKKNMQLIPWTVNEVDDMKQQIAIGVDGIITDYPDRLMDLCKRLGIDVR